MFGPTAEVEMAAYDKMFASNVRAPRIASRGHRVPRVRPRELHHRRDDRRRRRTSSGLDMHDAVWAQAHDDPDHVNHHQGAGHV
jgi:hypothetical protein